LFNRQYQKAKRRQSLKKIKKASLLLCLLIAGCTPEDVPAEVTSFRVIENGTTITKILDNAEYADFYIPEGMYTPFASNEMTADIWDLYNEARDDLGHFRETTLLPIDAFEYSKLLEIIRCEELSYFPLKSRGIGDFLADEGTFTVNFEYHLDAETAAETMTRLNSETEDVADEIFAEMPEGLDDYGKLRYLHDYLITNIETDDADSPDIYSSTLYGALVNKKALCEGYAKSFSYLCNRAGIENCIVVGMAKRDHMWNMVKLGGNWYHVDVTYDHPDEEIRKIHPDFISYQYFCVSDTVIENDHTLSLQSFTPPVANSVKENYYNREGYLIANENVADSVMTKALADAITAGRNFATVKCASTDLYMKISDKISEDGGFDEIDSAVKELTGVTKHYSVSDYYKKYRILTFFIED
jgi:hypothetical protein